MVIKWSAMGIGEGRGTFGAGVASKNRYGNYIRRNTKGVNPNTDKQAAVRAAFSAFAGQWRGLSDETRATWKDGAPAFPRNNKVGDTTVLAANALYSSLNGVVASVNSSLRSATTGLVVTSGGPVTHAVCPNPQSFVELVSPANVDAVFTADVLTGLTVTLPLASTAGVWIQVWGTTSLSAGIGFVPKSRYRLLASFAADANDDYNLLPAITASYGSFGTGTGVVHLSIRQVVSCGSTIEIARLKEQMDRVNE